MTPFASWRRQHAGHHNTWNNIDRRESGIDIYSSCLTVAEYRAKGPLDRALYRASRHPLFANLLLPPFIFTLLYRFPFDIPKSWSRERRAVHVTTVGLVVVLAGLCWMLGYQQVAAVQLSGLAFAAIVGTCMFSVQHRGVRTHWFRERAWNRTDAALEGTTYLELPAVLHWFTGNIGFHHIHHLNPAVPNYRLKECHEQIASLREMPTMSLLGAFHSIQLALWDEKQRRMVSFGAAARDATA
jgi:omega-6 fatty acid desaturase (delta-12 desaturase)